MSPPPRKRPPGPGKPGQARPPRRRTPNPEPEPPSRGVVPEAFRDAARGKRLHRVLAEAGVASRRDCEQMIFDGRVRVNGQVISGSPAWVDPQQDRVEVDGQPITRPRGRQGEQKHAYFALHKPRRVISTAEDDRGRVAVVDIVPTQAVDAPRGRLFPVGRLDSDSTGLILLTNDGELAHRLTHPRFKVAKQYEVSVRGRLSDDDVTNLREGLMLTQIQRPHRPTHRPVKRAAMSSVRLLGYGRDQNQGERTRLSVTLREGQNRQIRRMLAQLGFKVRRLKRTAIGPIKLKGLGVGQWRPLTSAEVRMLYNTTGLTPPRG